jgi:hypothetical protein
VINVKFYPGKRQQNSQKKLRKAGKIKNALRQAEVTHKNGDQNKQGQGKILENN